jgi:ABC-type polysaccharide/polyol phosphate export permease
MMHLYTEIWRRRDLIDYMVDGQQRAAVFKSLLGGLWHVLVPLAQTGIYYFLVVVVFSGGQARASETFIAIMMGVLHYALLYNVAGFAQPAIYGNASLLLQIKMEPIVLIAAGFARSLRVWRVGLYIYFVFFFALGGTIGVRLLAYPFILALFVLLCWTISVFVATAAVFIRDMERLLPILLQILMYAAPVIYSIDFYPERYQSLLLLNPLASIFALFHWSLLGSELDVLYPLVVVIVWILIGLVLAHLFYEWGRRRFTKVL